MDTTTEKEIQRALDNLVKGRTTIAIAHRLSTLRKADRLVVLDKGEIVEIGSHEQLMEAQGAYYTLYQAQLRHAAELVEGGAIGESLEEQQEEKQEEKLEVIAKEVGRGMSQTQQLERDTLGRLIFIDAKGNRHIGVHPVRAFPITAPGAGIGIMDQSGKELCWYLDCLLYTSPSPRD